MIKTAVIGASGFVGGHLWKAYLCKYPDAVGTAYSNKGPGLATFDLTNPAVSALRLKETGHREVMICSAKPNVAYCENEPEASFAVNVTGTLETIRQIASIGLKVIFLSSDYAFKGTTGNYSDDSETLPTTEYGRQKVKVEEELPKITDNFLVIRLSKIFGINKGDGTLLDELAQNFLNHRRMRIARDQIFCPTYVGDLTRAIDAVQRKGLTGTINIAAPDRISRHEVASRLGTAMGADLSLIESIDLYEIPSMVGRPLDTSITCPRLAKETGATFTPLDESIRAVVAQWK